MTDDRHPAIVRWQDIEAPAPRHYRGDTEPMEIGAALGRHFGFARLGIHHVRLLPGHRSSYPHAESDEDEFVFVLEGTPDVWLDGHLDRLAPGESVGFPAGTGIAHTFINNTDAVVRLLVVGDTPRRQNRIVYPLNPAEMDRRRDAWNDAPSRARGPHDGLPDMRRTGKEP